MAFLWVDLFGLKSILKARLGGMRWEKRQKAAL